MQAIYTRAMLIINEQLRILKDGSVPAETASVMIF